MSKGAWAATAADSIAVTANKHRGEVALQHTSGDPVWLGFGEPAEAGKGICLSASGPFINITDYRAMLEIHMVCEAVKTAGGGYQTA
jgi:hypothetical protein